MLVVKNLDEIFYDAVDEKEKALKIKLDEYSKLYIVNLLKNLVDNRNFFFNKEIDHNRLGISYMESMHENLFIKVKHLKIIGDLCLVFAGLFPDRYNRKLIDIDYLIRIGEFSFYTLYKIYDRMESLSGLKTLYYSIYLNILKIVGILIEIGRNFKFIDESNILKIYERWEKTGISSFYKILRDNNILPVKQNVLKLQ
ncbi:MAG: hypothetical protein K6348_04590 [Deferribacterales bacterium]